MEGEAGVVEAKVEAFDKAEILEAAKAAAREAVAATLANKDEGEVITKEDLEAALAEQQKRIAKQISGEDESETDPVLRALINQPRQTLSLVKEQAKEELREEFSRQEAQRERERDAFVKVFSDRPDIDKDSMSVIRGFLKEVDVDMEPEKRLREAVKQYDLFCESRGLGEAKERIAKASGGSATSPAKSSAESTSKSAAEIEKAELEEIKARQKSQRSW